MAERIDAVEQATARKSLDFECRRFAAAEDADKFLFEIDDNFRTGMREQVFVRFVIDFDRQKPVLQRIALEDIGDIRADDGAEAEIVKRPGRVLAR